MITPRRTRLCRVADLAAFRSTIADAIFALSPERARDTFVIVPTRAAAEQLRRTVEDGWLTATRPALVWPLMGTRLDLYDELEARLRGAPSRLSAFEREAVLAAVARRIAADGLTPAFQLRPGLVAEILALYDHIRRLGRTVEDFERNFYTELEREQGTDRGAEQLLHQTCFLAAVYRGYEAELRGAERSDEHVLRERLIAAQSFTAPRQVIVTVADRLADPFGLWPADFDLLTRLAGLEQIDVICTENQLAAGVLERIHVALPDIEEQQMPGAGARPILVTYSASDPRRSSNDLVLTHRDREEELIAVARRLKAERRSASAASLNRTALVVQRPLPYLYLARDVFADAAIPFEALDTLPLAAEPYAAAVDIVLDAVASDFTRASLLALLRSPHFDLGRSKNMEDRPLQVEGVSNIAIAACDFALAEARYLGDLDQLAQLVAKWEAIKEPTSREERRQQLSLPAVRAVLTAALPLRPLASARPMSEQVTTLIAWLRRFDRPTDPDDTTHSRRLRVRAALIATLAALATAYHRYDETASGDVHDVIAAIRRWLGSQTFATNGGGGGLRIVDAQAARYGEFDDVQIVGLIDGEWPERIKRNVLYPASLMMLLEPLPTGPDPAHPERDALKGARASFKDLLLSASARVRLSTFALENDVVVEPSILLDDIGAYGLTVERRDEEAIRAMYSEALALDPVVSEAVPLVASAWAAARLTTDGREKKRFQGDAGSWRLPRVSVSRLERYLDCPFRFFASEVLRVQEQPEDEDTRTPLERGRFLHELWERFFAEWQRRGHGRIEPDRLADARALFEALCEEALAHLTPTEAALERNRLLGSAVSAGIAHRVFAIEAERPARISRRLLEYPLQGEFTFRARSGTTRTVTLSAKADRIDVLDDGTLRVIDYKSKQTPDLKQALQLPIYSFCARDSLRRSDGQSWTIAEALYLSFEGDRAVVPLRAKGRTLDELLDDAQDRLLQALDDIAEGRFPPSPARRSLCAACPYKTVCRLEIIERTVEDGGAR